MTSKIEVKIEQAFKTLKERNIRNLANYVEIRAEKYFFQEWVNLTQIKQELIANGEWNESLKILYCKYISCILDCIKLGDCIEVSKFDSIKYTPYVKHKKITQKTMRLFKNIINDSYDALAYSDIGIDKEITHKILCAIEHMCWHYTNIFKKHKFNKSLNAEKSLDYLKDQIHLLESEEAKQLLQNVIISYSEIFEASFEESLGGNYKVSSLKNASNIESYDNLKKIKDNLTLFLEEGDDILPTQGQVVTTADKKFRKHSDKVHHCTSRQDELQAMNILNNLNILNDSHELDRDFAKSLLKKIQPIINKLKSKGRYSGWKRMRANHKGLATHQNQLIKMFNKINKDLHIKL